mmetsp:Transcript_19307/g.59959  ORF Transcript_19307/g.59959 Transcript_19307/m.59959 type:complete len:211 (-) Transcript_19307:764-1396(-)
MARTAGLSRRWIELLFARCSLAWRRVHTGEPGCGGHAAVCAWSDSGRQDGHSTGSAAADDDGAAAAASSPRAPDDVVVAVVGKSPLSPVVSSGLGRRRPECAGASPTAGSYSSSLDGADVVDPPDTDAVSAAGGLTTSAIGNTKAMSRVVSGCSAYCSCGARTRARRLLLLWPFWALLPRGIVEGTGGFGGVVVFRRGPRTLFCNLLLVA